VLARLCSVFFAMAISYVTACFFLLVSKIIVLIEQQILLKSSSSRPCMNLSTCALIYRIHGMAVQYQHNSLHTHFAIPSAHPSPHSTSNRVNSDPQPRIYSFHTRPHAIITPETLSYTASNAHPGSLHHLIKTPMPRMHRTCLAAHTLSPRTSPVHVTNAISLTCMYIKGSGMRVCGTAA
jgi:hypothetical protein